LLGKRVEKIKNIPFFNSLSRTALMKFQNYFFERTYTKGSILQKEGKPMSHLHLILEGEFEIIKTVQYPIGQKKFDLKEFLP